MFVVRSARAFPVKKGSPPMLHLLVSTQFRTQNRFALLLELLKAGFVGLACV